MYFLTFFFHRTALNMIFHPKLTVEQRRLIHQMRRIRVWLSERQRWEMHWLTRRHYGEHDHRKHPTGWSPYDYWFNFCVHREEYTGTRMNFNEWFNKKIKHLEEKYEEVMADPKQRWKGQAYSYQLHTYRFGTVDRTDKLFTMRRMWLGNIKTIDDFYEKHGEPPLFNPTPLLFPFLVLTCR